MKKFVRLRILDYGAAGLALGITILASLSVYAGSGSAEEVVVTGTEGRWIFPRDVTETLTVAGPLGDTVVELRDGEARVLASPCTNQLCIAAGAVRSHGQWIACMPNKVLISITGGETASARGLDEIDGSSW
jgi:hypothetical protein